MEKSKKIQTLNLVIDGNQAKPFTVPSLISLLDKWIEEAETQAAFFRKAKMEASEISSMAMAQAYRNVIAHYELSNTYQLCTH